MPAVFVDRDTLDQFHSDAVAATGDLVKQDIQAAPPLPSTEAPTPPPEPAPTFQPPTPSDTLTQPVPRAVPGPPLLSDLMATAGLASGPSPSVEGAAPATTVGATPAGGPPPLQNLLQMAGLSDTGVAGPSPQVAAAGVQAPPSGPPPLQNLLQMAGLADVGGAVSRGAQAVGGAVAGGLQSIMDKAQPFMGSGYVWGGKDPQTGFDCSGLAGYLAGTGQPESTTSLYGKSAAVDQKDLRPGDFVFYNMGQSDMHLQHVGTYIGDGKLVQAGGSQNTVNIADINQRIGSAPEFRRMDAGTVKSNEGVPAQLASAPAGTSSTQTTAGLSGGGGLSGQVGDRGQQILSAGAQAASWLGDQGQKALQAVMVTEGGLNNARGDNGQSVGPLQFYAGGQLANLAQQMGMGIDQAKTWVEQNPVAAVQWAIGTPDRPGYLGAAIQRGLQQGLSGADLATFAQQHGQVSVSPERAGQNFQAMFGGGQNVIAGAAGAVGQTYQNLAQTGGQLAQQGQNLLTNLTQPLGESPTAPIEREANQRMASLQDTLNTTLQANQQAQEQRSVQASTIGGGLGGRSAVNVTDTGAGGQTPEQIAGGQTMAQAEQPKPLWAQIGDTIGSAISQGLQPLVQAFQGGPTPAPEGGGYGAAPAGGANPLEGIAPALPQPSGPPAIVPEGGGYGATGAAPVEQTGPIGQAAIGAGQVAQQVQTPEAGSVPLGPVGQAIGTGVSALGTALHAGQEAIRQVSPVSGAARTVAGSDEYARQYAALGGVDLEREYRDLVQRRLNGEDGLEPRIQQIGDQLNTINAQITQGQPYEAAISQAAEQNPAFPAIETAANVGAAGLTLPLAAEGAPLAARVLAEVLQPGTNPLEVARGAFELVRGADAADPGTEQAVRAAWESFGQRWSDSAAQRERMLSRIGDPRGFLERVRDNLTSAGGAVARGAQGVLEDISRPTRGGVVGEAPAAANADRFYHGTGADFARPDAAQFNPNGLFGPGYYLTDDSRVAGGGSDGATGYAQARAVQEGLAPEQKADLLRRVDIAKATLANNPSPELRAYVEQDMAKAQAQLDADVRGMGANVRAVDVPKNLNLLDVDAPAPAGLVDRVRKQVGLEGAGFDVQDHLDGLPQKPTGQDVWQVINAGGGGERDYPNAVLQALGFDGIRYEGGKRIPLVDQAGAPIEHTAVAIFPDSLDKLTNATAGTRGGLLPDLAGENLARQVGARALVGGTSAAVQKAQDPNATPEDIARAAAQGAVMGAARPLIGRVIPGLRIAPEVGRIAQLIGGPPGSPRSFDLNALNQMRQQYQAQQPPLMNVPARVTPIDRFIGYTVASMLSRVSTMAHITVSQALQTVGRPVVEAAAGHPLEAERDIAAMAGSISDAFAAFGRTMQTGLRQGQTIPSPAVAAPLGLPLRYHSAVSEFFRVLNSAGASAAEASRLLREDPSLSFQDVLQRYPQQIVDAGTDAAARASFVRGGGFAGTAGQWIGQQRNALMQSADVSQRALGYILESVMPISHLPGVILGEGIRGLPGINEVRGVQRAVELARGTPQRTLAGGQVLPAVAGSHYAAQQELAMTALRTFRNFAILSEVSQGNITGDGPSDPAARARLMEAVDKDGNAVWRPNSVRIGGRWFDYTGLGPIHLAMSSIANAVETATDWTQKPPEKRGDLPELAQEMGARELKTIGNAWYLKGLADLLSGIKEGTLAKGAGTTISSVADRLVPASGLLDEIRGMTDPYAREPQNILEREASRIPGLSTLVQPRLETTTGKPEEQPHDILSTILRGTPPGMMTPNPVATEIDRLTQGGNAVSVPSNVKTYAGAQQTPQQQRLIQEQLGQATNQYVLNTMNQPAYAKLSDAQKADALKKAVGQADSLAKLTLGGQVARSPHESALLQLAQTPQFSGISSRLSPDQIARANWEIENAKAKLAEYTKQYKDAAENRLQRDDPVAYRLSQRDRLDKEVIDRKKAAIDKATGGALSRTDQQAAAGGLVGAGSTVVNP